jgi:ABC-type spermidine/putrescine transport system permease subunit I
VGAGVGRVQVGLEREAPLAGVAFKRWGPRQLLLLPTVVGVLAFFLVPLGMVITYSFARISLITYDIHFGWTVENYRALADPLYLHTVIRSVLLSLSTTIGCLVIGFPLAYFISRQSLRWQRVLLILVIVPFWTSFIVRVYATENLLANGGPVDDIAGRLGLTSGHINLLYSSRAIAIGIIYSYLPTMVLPIYVALERIDPALFDAASDLGASGRRTFMRVTLPLSLPGVVVACLIVGIPAMGEFVIPEILGGGKTLMLGNVISEQYLDVGNIPFGSAIAVALIASMSLVLFARRYLRPGFVA